MAVGKVGALTAAERQRSEPRQLSPRPMARAWEYWTTRLAKAGALPPPVKPAKTKPAKARPTKGKSKPAQSKRRGR
jgi:hypothetical protein